VPISFINKALFAAPFLHLSKAPDDCAKAL